MKKSDLLYKELLKTKVFSTEDALGAAKKILGEKIRSGYVYHKYLRPMLKDGKVVRARQGIYVALDPTETPQNFSFDPIILASKIRKSYYLGFHSALEFYGCANSQLNTIYVCVDKKDRFHEFSFRGFDFKPVYSSENEIGIVETRYISGAVRVSSRERTFVDCIDRPEYAGGWEECMKSLDGLGGLDFGKITQIISIMGHDVLARKAGFVLEKLRDASMYYRDLGDSILGSLEKMVGNSPAYLERGKPSILDEKWKLYIPKNFDDYLRGL